MSESALAKRQKARRRTKVRIRKTMVGTDERPRATVFKSGKHLYAQVISDVSGKTLASASTLDAEFKDRLGKISKEETHSDARSTKSVAAARAVGKLLAQRSLEKKISKVVFDRNGYVFKGRVKALAEGAREGGLQF